jgi:hypothetical protein
MSLTENPLWAKLDMAKVTAAAANYRHVIPADWDMIVVGEMIEAAMGKWLMRDCTWMELSSLEEMYDDADGEKGVTDMRGVFTSEAPEKLRGKTFVRDWKTASGKLDLLWESRLKDSLQWKFYLAHTGAEIFIFSGVNYKGEMREALFDRPEFVQQYVRSQLMGVDLAVEAWNDAGLLVWPRATGSCLAYGRTCDYLQDCRNYTMPQVKPLPFNWSPSSVSNLMLCPERWRRNILAKQAGAPPLVSYSTEVGKAFHRGMEEVYRQAFGMPEKEREE